MSWWDTSSRLGNDNENQQPRPRRVIERVPEVVPIAEPITMEGVQAMIQTMLVE